MVSRLYTSIALVALAGFACKPDLDDTLSLIEEPRVLAIQAEPAEAAPGATVTWRALYVSGDDQPIDGSRDLDWAQCLDRKPLAELGPVSPRCLEPEAEWLIPMGTGVEVSGQIPRNACRNFGPEVPEAAAGEKAGRPVDPDATGGFYQPVRIWLRGPSEGYIISNTRLSCGLAGVTPDILKEYQSRYIANTNPSIVGLHADGEGWEAGDPGAGVNVVDAGQNVELQVVWDDCETGPCGGAERYVAFDPETRSIVERREAIRISWYTDAGAFEEDRSGRGPDEFESFNHNTWTAPNTPGLVRLHVVIRDERGGVGWSSYLVEVR